MEAKIKVYGTAQNRTALGIANAYLRLNPNSTLDDLNRAFPETINNATSSDLFVVATEDAGDDAKMRKSFFEKPEEQITLKDGTKVMMFETWGKADYERIVEHAKQYQIVVAEIKPSQPFEKGGFVLEEIGKKKIPWWLWLIIILIIILLLILLFRSCNKEKPVVPEPKVEVVADTAKAAEPAINLQEKFSPIHFDKAQFAVTEAQKPALTQMANVLKEFDKATLRVEGHASKDGSLQFNIKLAEKRAKAIADFFVGQGIASERIASTGYGISRPIDEQNLEPNRRVELYITE